MTQPFDLERLIVVVVMRLYPALAVTTWWRYPTAAATAFGTGQAIVPKFIAYYIPCTSTTT